MILMIDSEIHRIRPLCCLTCQPDQPHEHQKRRPEGIGCYGGLPPQQMPGALPGYHRQQTAQHCHRHSSPGQFQTRTRPQAGGNAVHRQHRCQQSCLPDSEIAGAVRVGPGGIGIDRQHKPQVPCRECIGALFCQPGSQAPQPAPRQLAGAQQDQQHSTGDLRHSAQGSQPAARQHRQSQQAAADQSQGPDRPGRYMDAGGTVCQHSRKAVHGGRRGNPKQDQK